VVLSDHWDDMRRHGFFSNRLFDAAACGARVVSDDVPGADDLFEGLVRVYRSPEELVELVRDHRRMFPDDAARAEIGRRLGRRHSFEARARILLDAALGVTGPARHSQPGPVCGLCAEPLTDRPPAVPGSTGP
jgi:spore maturation protein CgeB